MVDDGVEGLKEPGGENLVVVGEKEAAIDGMRNLWFSKGFSLLTTYLQAL
ncbi:hypothetical protein ES708_24885 [subsurface metagenome]